MEIVQVATSVAALATGICAIVALCQNTREKRLENLSALWTRLRSRQMFTVFYIIDYEKPWYDERFHNKERTVVEGDGASLEASIDEFLTALSFVCVLQEKKAINRNDRDVFEYELTRTLQNPQVIDYLYNLHHDAQAHGTRSVFHSLEAIAKERGYIAIADFDDPRAYERNPIYHNNLGW